MLILLVMVPLLTNAQMRTLLIGKAMPGLPAMYMSAQLPELIRMTVVKN
jgi:hypothetical protein